jgi:organic radical activating enzyme
MLHIEMPNDPQLNSKAYSICITNICNLSCGGCNQLCGLFAKDKLWLLEVDKLRDHLENSVPRYVRQNWLGDNFPPENKHIVIYGGEPTLHPEFDKIVDLLYEYPEYPFLIFTNGRTFPELEQYASDEINPWYKIMNHALARDGYAQFADIFATAHTHHKNVGYRIDFKTPRTKNVFAPTLVSPADLDNNQDRDHYVRLARHHCYQWLHCEAAIYNGKAYACHIAAAMDHMYNDGDHGWQLDKNVNPFEKTEAEVDAQLEHFCYRCGYNFGGEKAFNKRTGCRQFINEPTLYTITNAIEHKSDAMKEIPHVNGDHNNSPTL